MLSEQATVLFADDDFDDRFLFEQAWRQSGIANPLLGVDSGKRALDWIMGTGEFADRSRYPRPAFLLLDLKMPGLSGFDVLKRLREREESRALPVIIFTASTSPKDVVEAYRLGVNAFFVKPSTVRELIALLAALKDFWLCYNEFPAG